MEPFLKSFLATMVDLTRVSSELPVGAEYQYMSTFPVFRSAMSSMSQKILQMTQGLVDSQTADAGSGKPDLKNLTDVQDIDDEYEGIADIVDGLVERVDVFMDDINGLTPETKISVTKTANFGIRGGSGSFQYASNVIRPQEMWKDDIDNSSNPFVPRIRFKPNAMVPLDDSIVRGTLEEDLIDDLAMREHVTGTMGVKLKPKQFPHPYEYELTHLGYEGWMMDSRPEIPYGSLEETPITFVDTEEGLQKLSSILDSSSEIAIDLEAHQYRSFQGFTCLMQISTRHEDFIVDTLALRRHLFILNKSFTNPKIVKVIHGSDFDILWLQRDLGLYVVNMFDTGQAARVLEFPSYALSYLLKLYCGINADKQYQKADWRIRPLPDPMFKYAREDTHYLLFIYDKMRNEALARVHGSKELVHAILNRSKDLCLQRYEKDQLTPTSFMDLLSKFRSVDLTHQQIEVFSAVYAWRDSVCRLEDESTRYVLPNHMIFQIAEKMPEDDKSLQLACIPVPPLVKMNMPELLNVIKKAKIRGAENEARQALKPSRLGSGYGQLPDVPADVTSSEDLIRQAGWTDSGTSFSIGSGFDVLSASSSSGVHGAIGGGLSSSSGMFSASSFLGDESGGSTVVMGGFDLASSGSGFSGFDAAGTSSMASFGQDLAFSKSLELQDSAAKSRAEEIRSSFNSASWIPSTAHIVTQESMATDKAYSGETTTASKAPSGTFASKVSDGAGLFDDIPQSMDEIYKKSNQSKKNKKKRDAEHEVTSTAEVLGSPQSPFFVQDGEGVLDIRAAKRAKMTETEADRDQFVTELGWGSNTPSKPPAGSSTSSSSHKSQGQKGHSSSNQSDATGFTPYDYSKHKSARPAPGHAQQSAARGQHSDQSINPYGTSSDKPDTKERGGRGEKSHRGGSTGGHGGHSHGHSGHASKSNHRGGGSGGGRGGHHRGK
jgi:ribonuclease D